MSKDDRNTAIIVAVVLVVCTISLVVIGGYVWRLLSPGLNSTLKVLGLYVRVTTTNYNFTVPKKGTNLAGGTATPVFQLPDGYTYNFFVPADYDFTQGVNITGTTDYSIVADARAQGYGLSTNLTQVDGFISIPGQSIASPVYSGNVGTELQQGFWVYPRGQRQVFLCQRQYFGRGDARSCWDLDQLTIGSEIFLTRGDTTSRYVVREINIITNAAGLTYAASGREIQLITSSPLELGLERLQIIAAPAPESD